MTSQEPQVSRSSGCFVRWLGNVVGIRQAHRGRRFQESEDLLRGETGHIQVDIHLLQFGQLQGQQVIVPLRQTGRLVIGDSVCFDLSRRKTGRDVHRDFFQSQFERCLVTCVANDDDPFFINHDRLSEAELPNGCGHGIHRLVINARVSVVGSDGRDRTQLHFHSFSWNAGLNGASRRPCR